MAATDDYIGDKDCQEKKGEDNSKCSDLVKQLTHVAMQHKGNLYQYIVYGREWFITVCVCVCVGGWFMQWVQTNWQKWNNVTDTWPRQMLNYNNKSMN